MRLLVVELEAGYDIVVDRVCQMVQQVLEGPDSCHRPLCKVAQYGQHSQSPILNLFELQILEGFLIFTKPERVEQWASWVGWVARPSQVFFKPEEVLLPHWPWVGPVLESPVLCKSHQCHLEYKQCVRVCPVVVCPRWGEYPGFEPRQGGLRWDEAQLPQYLRRNRTNSTQHGIPPVDDLPVG